MISKEALRTYLNKKVFVKVIDDKVQVGILRLIGDDFFLESPTCRTTLNLEQVARITEQVNGKQGDEDDRY